MSLLTGQTVVALGGMAERPLGRFLASLGAEVVSVAADAFGVGTHPQPLPFREGSLQGAGFLIEDLGLERLADRGWTRAAIEAANPALVHVSVTPFGSFGPRARWQGGELVASAMGGALRLTGEPDRAPVKEALDACTFHADMMAAAGAMAAHHARGSHGRGQHVDVSIQEVAFSRNVNGVLVWQFDRRKLHRVGGALNYGKATVKCIWRLADGWCFHSLMTGRFGAPANQGLSDWIDAAGMPNPLHGVDWLSYNRSTLPAETRAAWEAGIAAFFATRTKEEIRTEGRRRGINACVVNAPGDVLADGHLTARGFWDEADGAKVPGRFLQILPGTGRGTSRRLVEGARSPHASAPVESGAPSTTGFAGGPPPRSGEDFRSGPLSGVRVLDFSWALVGSITTKILGDLGAEVVKVETRTRPCLSRLDVQVSASRPGNFDDKPWFAHLNTSKRSLSLDMKKPEAWELLGPLIEWADVVVENFSPGTMAKLGLGYDSLAARNPGIVMVSGSVYGQTGPLAQEWGVDGTGGALSGRTYLTGWADRDPVIPGAVPYGDVILPPAMAATVAAALQRRRETGQGCHIDASMYELCVQQMRGAILAAQTGPAPQRTGNTDAGVFFQDVFAAAGEDRWVAVSVADAAHMAALETLAGHDVAGWIASRPDSESVDLLQQAGIAAGVVQDIEDLFADPSLAARGALVELDHPHLGGFGHVRTPISFSADLPQPFRAPGIGEHNQQIARLAGVSDTRFAELDASGVFQ